MSEFVEIIPDNEEQDIEVEEEKMTVIYGDMLKSVYDKNDNGIVDKATGDALGNEITSTYAKQSDYRNLNNRVATLEDSGFITKDVNDLTYYSTTNEISENYYNKTNIDTQKSDVLSQLNNPSYSETTGESVTITNARVGEMDFTYYGNTTQNSDPTPTNPVEVKNVTGENNLYIEGTNKFNFEGFKSGSSATITGTADNFTYSGANITTQYYYHFKPNTYYHIGGTWSTTYGNFRLRIIYTDSDSTMIVQDYSSASASGTININSSNTLTIQSIEFTTWTTGNITLKNFRIVEGNTDKDFEPFTQQSFNFNLASKNLLQFPYADKTKTENGITWIVNDNGSITISGTSTNSTFFKLYDNQNFKLINDTSNSYTINVGLKNGNLILACFDYVSGSLSRIQSDQNFGSKEGIAFTPTNNGSGQMFRLGIGSGVNLSSPITIYPMLLKGNYELAIPPFEQYSKIELCKIDCYETNFSRTTTYQDYLYNNGGKWIKHKAIGKTTISVESVKTNYTALDYAVINRETNDIDYNTYGTHKCYCNLGISTNKDNDTPYDNIFYLWKLEGKAALTSWWFGITKNTTLADAQSMLNGGYIYYILATPIEEEITDTTTLYYLNNIKAFAQSYYGTTNIMITTNNAQPTIKVKTINKLT